MNDTTPSPLPAKPTPRRMFPIMHSTDIPWEVIAPFEKQALTNHSQTLQRLADRGGLSPQEAYYILIERPWPWRKTELWAVDEATAKQRLREIVDAHENSELQVTKRELAQAQKERDEARAEADEYYQLWMRSEISND